MMGAGFVGSRRFSPWMLLAVLAGIVFLLFVGIRYYADLVDSTGADIGAGAVKPAPASSTPVEVQVAPPIRRDLTETITLSANVAPMYQTTLYAKVSGYLKWIGVDKGDRVKKGQILAVIDAPEVEEQYHEAVADYRIKQLTYERMANVWKQSPDVIAKQDVDMAEAAFQGARHLMEQRIALRDYTRVRAPYDGVITARFVDPGALIQVATASATGAIPLLTIMDLSTVRVYTNVPQEQAPVVKPGTQAALVVKDLAGRTFTGSVTRSTLALDPSTRSMLVEVDLPNADGALQPGMFGEITLVVRQIPEALVIPPTAVATSGSTKYVFVADRGRARLVSIKTGATDGRWIQVLDGLVGTEDVIVVGKQQLTDGTPVEPRPYTLPEGTPSRQRY
jgi:membrane fusion protein (multidrug efflux system)